MLQYSKQLSTAKNCSTYSRHRGALFPFVDCCSCNEQLIRDATEYFHGLIHMTNKKHCCIKPNITFANKCEHMRNRSSQLELLNLSEKKLE